VKLARQHGVEDLLPHTVKGTEERLRRRMENGLRVKGTGIGQRVKGKESERTLKGRYVWNMDSIDGGIEIFWAIKTDRYFQQIGEAQTGNVRNAPNDTDMERGKIIDWFEVNDIWLITFSARTWPWVEEVAEINLHLFQISAMMTSRCMSKIPKALRTLGFLELS
jgi:hypothetical protein